MAYKNEDNVWNMDIAPYPKIIITFLARNSSEDGVISVSWTNILQRTGISRASLSYILKAFEDVGVISREHRQAEDGRNISSIYRILTDIVDKEAFKLAYRNARKYKYKKKALQEWDEVEEPTIKAIEKAKMKEEETQKAQTTTAERIKEEYITPWNSLAREVCLDKITISDFWIQNIVKKEGANAQFKALFTKAIISEIKKSPYLLGASEATSKYIEFGWLLDNVAKVASGKYAIRIKKQPQQAQKKAEPNIVNRVWTDADEVF